MSKRIDDIEILRAFAVIFVVLHHSLDNLFTWSNPSLTRFAAYFGGGFGVDLFFAISGFVIARDLLPRLRASISPEQSVRITAAFWIRRAWRLLPSAWTWLVVILLASIFFNESGAFGAFHANLEATVAGVLQVANLRFAETFGRSEYGASFVYWTLSLEEQFYLALPLLALLTRRFLVPVLIALVLIQLISSRTLMGVMFRTDSIALGVLLAIWSQSSTYAMVRPEFLQRRGQGKLVMAGAFLCMGVLGGASTSVVSYKFSLLAVLSAILVWIASYNLNILAPGRFFKELLIWVGTRSYAIYLIHIPAFFMIRETWFRLHQGQPPSEEMFFYFLGTSAVLIASLSELNYRFIETPFRRHGAVVATHFLCAKPRPPASDHTPEKTFQNQRNTGPFQSQTSSQTAQGRKPE